MAMTDVSKLADEIIAGRRLSREDDLQALVQADLEALCQGADRIREALLGDRVDLCTIISGRKGRCSENCRYCAQSAFNQTKIEEHPLLSADTIAKEGRANEAEGVDRFCIVNAGYGPTPEDFETMIEAYEKMHETLHLEMCVSSGFMSREQFKRLKAAGVSGAACNLETSRRFFPQICTTHTFDEKIENIKRAQAEGLAICSGGIIGLGETWEDRMDLALTLQELGVKSIPLNSLMPMKGTPLEDQPRLSEEEIRRCVAIFRYINPAANIRLAGGRALMKDNGKGAFLSGASAAVTGNMLTTTGTTIRGDREMLRGLGRSVKEP